MPIESRWQVCEMCFSDWWTTLPLDMIQRNYIFGRSVANWLPIGARFTPHISFQWQHFSVSITWVVNDRQGSERIVEDRQDKMVVLLTALPDFSIARKGDQVPPLRCKIPLRNLCHFLKSTWQRRIDVIIKMAAQVASVLPFSFFYIQL